MDYLKLGFKAGLEIHQQLDTGKLFCNCPGILRNEKGDFTVMRKLHAVAGETGEIDEAVKHEASLDREFIYEGYNDTTCLIELDEEPPKQINERALNEALKIALLLNCEIYPVSQVMRKTVIDGSNTSGFQRTVLIAHSGFIETSFGKVGIDTICLEEDSARIVSKDEKKAIYRLDRLGIPLIEIATSPVITNPEQIKEAALRIGELLRVCNVKRGIGTIRQDINVSSKGHPRVEIKGFQDPKMMAITAEKEIERQQEELERGEAKGQVRAAKDDGSTVFMRPMPGKARMYPETDLPLLRIGKEIISQVQKNLPKLTKELKKDLEKQGLSNELITLVLDGHFEEYQNLIKIYSRDANLVGKMITLWRSEFASKSEKSFDEIQKILNEDLLGKVLEAVERGKVENRDVKQILNKIVNGIELEEALNVEKIDNSELEEAVKQVVKEKPGLRAGAYMGMLIAKLGANIDKKRAMELLQKLTE